MDTIRWPAVTLAVIGLATLPLLAGAQQGRPAPLDTRSPLQGIVLDEVSGLPIESAVVSIVGSGLTARTDSYGSFGFANPPIGRISVRVSAPDLVSMVEEVEVRDGSIVHVQFLLPPLDALLAEFLVPPGSTVGEPATAADLVARRVPGLLHSVTMVGDGDRAIRLRGVNTFTGGGEPQLFVDGVRVTGTGTIYSTLMNIPASDVDRIDVLRGPAAAFLHPYAANGVIHVYTRTGTTEGR